MITIDEHSLVCLGYGFLIGSCILSTRDKNTGIMSVCLAVYFMYKAKKYIESDQIRHN